MSLPRRRWPSVKASNSVESWVRPRLSLSVSFHGVFKPGVSKVLEASGGTALHSSRYHLLPCDLRLPPSVSLAPVLNGLLSPSLPALLLCECVLVYISPESSSALFDWFVNHFTATPNHGGSILGTIVYEMFGLQDAFGHVMLNNLRVCLPRYLRRCLCLIQSQILVKEYILAGCSPISHGGFAPCTFHSIRVHVLCADIERGTGEVYQSI